jgi:hypothetical protein
MRLISRKGQSTGEYAILFAIVLGAVVAMQNYIRNRLTGTLQAGADNYLVAASVAVPGAKAVAPDQQTTSSSDTWLDLDKAGVGDAGSGSGSRSFRNQ